MSKVRLEKRVFLRRPASAGVGKFIPYCNYEKHEGVLKGNWYYLCEKRKCKHYLRLYISYKEMSTVTPKDL